MTKIIFWFMLSLTLVALFTHFAVMTSVIRNANMNVLYVLLWGEKNNHEMEILQQQKVNVFALTLSFIAYFH